MGLEQVVPALLAGLVAAVASPAALVFFLQTVMLRWQEGVKASFGRELETYRAETARTNILYQRRADALARLWPAIRSAEDAAQELMRSLIDADTPSEIDRLNGVVARGNELTNVWDSVEVFVPELTGSVERFQSELKDCYSQFRWARTKELEGMERHKHWKTAQELARKKLPASRAAIRNEILRLVGHRNEIVARDSADQPKGVITTDESG
jgi:hypothetical protein